MFSLPSRRWLLLFCLLAPAIGQAADGLNRCVGNDGIVIYTDRPCSGVQAIPENSPLAGDTGGTHFARNCARTREDLLEGLRGALEAGDVNRLASFYHWPGQSSSSAEQLMDRLDTVSKRPLVSIAWVPTDPPPVAFEASALSDLPPPPPPPPMLIRVEQFTRRDSIETVSTVFQLRANAGCWWVSF